MFDSYFYALSEELQKKILKEMSSPRRKALSYIENSCDTVQEHFVKIIVFGNSTGNLVSWKKTLANILNYCNGILTKSKNGKFTKKEYLEYLFGIDDTFDEHDAFNMLYRFEIDFGKKSPPFEKTPTLTAKLYNFYKEFANYFSDFLSTDSGKEDRMQEIQQKITEIMSK